MAIWKKRRQLKGKQCILVCLEPPVCLLSQNDHWNSHKHPKRRMVYIRHSSSLASASLDIIKFQWKLALFFFFFNQESSEEAVHSTSAADLEKEEIH